MSTATQVVRSMPVSTNGRYAAEAVEEEAQPLTRFQRLKKVLRHGELRITPMTNGDEKIEYAQRWPVGAIAGVLLTALGMAINTTLTLCLAGLMLYVNANKDGSVQRETEIRELGDNKTAIAVANGKIETLLRENTDLKADVRILQNDIKVVKMAQGLDIKGVQ